MFQAVLHLCWLNLRFPLTAQSVAPLIATNNRRLDQVEAGREFWWDDRLVRFHLAYDRYCRGTDKPISLGSMAAVFRWIGVCAERFHTS